MITNTRKRRGAAGYISYVLVLTTGALLTLMTFFGFRRAMTSQSVQADVQLRVDYSEKEDAVLRSLISIVPNRAIRAMQNSSALSGANRDSLRWQNIFSDAIAQANATTAVSAQMKTAIGKPNARVGNTGDGALGTTNLMFTNVHNAANSVYVTSGISRNLGAGYPTSLTSSSSTVTTNDAVYPIISKDKKLANDAQFQVMKYPQISFGYVKPGENFLAKRNWWAFSVDMANHDKALTPGGPARRNFVLSIYEIPSQLAISASSYMAFGKHESGADWQNVSVEGNVFAGKAKLEGATALPSLASRRSVELDSGTTIGGRSFNGSPFTPGVREQYEVDNAGFFPVSMPSESGRATFVPINRGEDFFDAYSTGNIAESNTLSTTTWNNYSSGAYQCAMKLEVTKGTNSGNTAPTELKFTYLQGNTPRELKVAAVTGFTTNQLGGYMRICDENQSYVFNEPVDVAYGAPGGFAYKNNVSGVIPFNNTTFGDPLVGTFKGGYWRPRVPFATIAGPANQVCIAIYPERFPKFLADLGADDTTRNNSLVVNADYRSGLYVKKPEFPSKVNDIGLIMTECSNLSAFTKGFSIVTNFRLYIGSDFNQTPIAAPPGYTGTLPYYPPCSLFAPEKRYGVEVTPFSVGLNGHLGSLAPEPVSPTDTPIRPLDAKGHDNEMMMPSQTRVNLRPLVDPADLPPISMMNWLVVIEERNKQFY